MDTNKYIAWCSSLIVFTVGFTSILTQIRLNDLDTSSPVEEMYHRQLVTTLDSIFDARFDASCCLKDDDISIPHDSLGRVIMPKDLQ